MRDPFPPGFCGVNLWRGCPGIATFYWRRGYPQKSAIQNAACNHFFLFPNKRGGEELAAFGKRLEIGRPGAVSWGSGMFPPAIAELWGVGGGGVLSPLSAE